MQRHVLVSTRSNYQKAGKKDTVSTQPIYLNKVHHKGHDPAAFQGNYLISNHEAYNSIKSHHFSNPSLLLNLLNNFSNMPFTPALVVVDMQIDYCDLVVKKNMRPDVMM